MGTCCAYAAQPVPTRPAAGLAAAVVVAMELDIVAALLFADDEDDDVVLVLEHAARPISATAETPATTTRLY